MNPRLLITVVLLTAVTSSCGVITVAPTPTMIPTDTPIPLPSLQGRLIVGHPDGMFALVKDSATDQFREIEIRANWSDEVAISPDHRFLVSSDATTGTQMVDLSTYEVTTLFPDQVDCLQWSSNGTRLVYKLHQIPLLYVDDLTSQTSTLIYEAPSASYLGATQYGDVRCPQWIGEDRLLFDRFSGEMPSMITIPGAPELLANTTSLAILGNEIQILDSPERLYLVDVSADESKILISKQSQLYLVDSFNDFQNMNMHSLAAFQIWDTSGQFIPNSNEIILENEQEVLFVDIEGLKIVETFTKPPDWQLYSFRNGEWVGDPNDAIIVWDLGEYIVVGDFRTGIKTEVWQISKYGFTNWLIWLP